MDALRLSGACAAQAYCTCIKINIIATNNDYASLLAAICCEIMVPCIVSWSAIFFCTEWDNASPRKVCLSMNTESFLYNWNLSLVISSDLLLTSNYYWYNFLFPWKFKKLVDFHYTCMFFIEMIHLDSSRTFREQNLICLGCVPINCVRSVCIVWSSRTFLSNIVECTLQIHNCTL